MGEAAQRVGGGHLFRRNQNGRDQNGPAQPESLVLKTAQHQGHGFLRLSLGRSLGENGVPDIFNTDQGSRFTSFAFTNVLRESGIRISMGGRGRRLDNVCIERLWRSLKYENVYLSAYETGSEARAGIGRWITFCGQTRPHSSLGGQTPDSRYHQELLKATWEKTSQENAIFCPNNGDHLCAKARANA